VFYAASLDRRWARLACFAVLAFMAFLLAWSGGRAAIITIVAFLTLTLAFRIIPIRPVLLSVLALAVGAVLAIASGHADLLLMQVQKSGSSAEVLSSGRLSVWIDSLGVWAGSWSSFLFGLGPDAMRLYVRAQIGFPPVVQAHNSFVQVLLEFGLIGCGFFIALITLVGRRVVRALMERSAAREARVVAAILTVMFGYTLLDGILYHAIPLVFVMLLTAYLFSFDVPPRAGTASVTKSYSSTDPDPKTQS
jgi:O-antigen ligase